MAADLQLFVEEAPDIQQILAVLVFHELALILENSTFLCHILLSRLSQFKITGVFGLLLSITVFPTIYLSDET